VTHNNCRRQPLVFKQVKTFLAPPNLTSPPKRLGLDPPLVAHIFSKRCYASSTDITITYRRDGQLIWLKGQFEKVAFSG